MIQHSVQELIIKFENTIRCDCRGNLVKAARSSPARLLARGGRDVLAFVAAHLEANPPDKNLNLHICWGMLLNDIAININNWEKPGTYDDIEGWVAWAKREAGKT
ncbi:MAG: hypothetical protein ACOYUZ_04795 [Patescibacteria group bacterium]